MIYSYTQLSHYLACPRKLRYRYVNGWQEKETRAGLLFGRAFEQALGAYFHRQDPTEELFKVWSQYQNATLVLGYSFGHAVATMLVLLAKSFIQAVHRLRALHQQHAHERVPLFADRSQPASVAREQPAKRCGRRKLDREIDWALSHSRLTGAEDGAFRRLGKRERRFPLPPRSGGWMFAWKIMVAV